jgi:3-oxo-4,17-pregnadiene-20-carboxyl-CoA hydratase alpha subunit
VVAVVELADGPRMISNVTQVRPGDVHVGMPVTCYAVRVRDDLGLPFRRPSP